MLFRKKIEAYIKGLVVEALRPELDELFEKIAIETGGEIRIAALNLKEIISRCPSQDH